MRRVAQKAEKVEFRGKRCWVGVDVHKLTYYVAILSEDGFRTEFSFPSEPIALIKQLHSGFGIIITGLAYESGPTGFELAWSCQESSIPVTVAASSKIPRQITADGKTDRLDGIKLAEYLSKGMLRGIAIPTRDEFGLREIERRRQQLVRARMKLRQQIRGFLLKNKIREPQGMDHWSGRVIGELKEVQLNNAYLRLTLDSYLNQLEFICAETERMKKALSQELIKQGK